MPEDRSLDEFAAPDADETRDDTDETPDDIADTADANRDPAPDASATDISGKDGVEPAVSTSTWTGGGTECDRCGARTERLWRDDGAAVCADCKEW